MQDLMEDGYLFYTYKRTPSAKYFRCILFKRGCPVRAVRTFITGEVSLTGQHCHAPDLTRLPYLQEREDLVNEARRLDVASLRDIFNAPRNNDSPFAHLLTPHRLGPAMSRARRSVLPEVQNIEDFVRVLDNPTFACVAATSNFDDSIYGGSAQTTTGRRVILFMSSKCKQVLMSVEQIFVFITPMADQYWICSIAGLLERLVVRLAWLVLDDLSGDTLTTAFALLRSLLPTHRLKGALCGNEDVAMVITNVFGISVLPTLFDYVCDLKQFISRTPISAQIIAQSRKLKDVLNHCCSLPLLPSDFLQLGINTILSESAEFTSFVQSTLQNLFHHITINWLQHPIKGSKFSVSDSNERTNYQCEEIKSKAQRDFQRTSDLYSVAGRIVFQTEKMHTLISNLVGNRDVSLDPVAFIDNARVKLLTEDLRTPLLTQDLAVKNFLHITAGMLQHVNF